MDDKLVRDVMHTGVISCAPQTPLPNVALLLHSNHIHSLVVIDDEGDARGMVSQTDLLRHFGEDSSGLTAADVMTRGVRTTVADARLAAAIEIMLQRGINRLPVVEHPSSFRPIGILSISDVIADMAKRG